MRLSKFTRNTLLAAVAATLSSSAYAQAIPIALVATGFAIYLFPAVLGLLITKKGRRRWFVRVSVAAYAASFLAAYLHLFGGSTFMVSLFLPCVLVPVAIYARRKNSAT